MKCTKITLLLLVCCVVVVAGCKKKPVTDVEGGTQVESPTTNIPEDNGNTDSDSSSNGEGPDRYQLEKATITYGLSGTIQSGKETLVFDQHGRRESRESEITVGFAGVEQTTHSFFILKDGRAINYDVDKRTGTDVEQPDLATELEAGAQRNDMDMTEVGMVMIEAMNGVKEGTKQILGRTCDLWYIEQLGTRTCLRKGVPIETDINFLGQRQYLLATAIEEGVADPTVFEVPDDIDFSASEKAQELIDQFLNN